MLAICTTHLGKKNFFLGWGGGEDDLLAKTRMTFTLGKRERLLGESEFGLTGVLLLKKKRRRWWRRLREM